MSLPVDPFVDRLVQHFAGRSKTNVVGPWPQVNFDRTVCKDYGSVQGEGRLCREQGALEGAGGTAPLIQDRNVSRAEARA